MLGHMGQHTGLVLEETDVAQLVHLVTADNHGREPLAHIYFIEFSLQAMAEMPAPGR